MNPVQSPFATPAAWMHGAHLARVVAIDDPEGLGRVKVAMYATDPDEEAALWARVAVPFAGNNYGAFLIPDVGEEVIVMFVAGAANAPIVVGALWNGNTEVPEALPGKSVDRWTLCGKAGTRIAIVEEKQGEEKVEIETPGGAKATLTDAAGGEIRFEVGTNKIKMDSAGIEISTGQKLTIKASTMEVSSPLVDFKSGHAKFTNAVQSDTVITSSVISGSYTPGAGNVW